MNMSIVAKVEDMMVALLLLSLVGGSIAIPLFLNVTTTGMSSTQLLAWQAVLTIVMAAIAIGFIGYMRTHKR